MLIALGASAINMGTRFVATVEAAVHQNVKNQIVANTERDTALVFRKFRNTARVARNAVSDQVLEIERREGTAFADIAALASGARGREAVLQNGRMDDGLWWTGQSQALITEVLTCGQVVESIVAEAEDLLTRRLNSLVVDLGRRNGTTLHRRAGVRPSAAEEASHAV
jgi:nitronate monooxygenase